MQPRPTQLRILALILLLVALSACGRSAAEKESEARKADYKEKYAKAKALFEERCKTAGVVVKRTFKDVEGIELLKVRPEIKWGGNEYFDPMFEGAAMAGEAKGNSYIASFLYAELRNPHTPEMRGVLQPPETKPGLNQEAPRLGYRFVDVRDPNSGELWRYRAVLGLTDEQWRTRGGWAKDLERSRHVDKSARYAIDYEDIVDPSDRSFWIAGTKLKVIDQSNGEVIAQLTHYVWDPGFGVSTTGRWPWDHASSRESQQCPASPGLRGYLTRYFVDTVLIPKQGD